MKLTTVIVLFTFMSVTASVYSQVTKLNLKVQDRTVKEILNQIEDESDFFFMYNDRKIDVSRRVNLDLRQAKIEDILGKIFEGTDVKFIVKNRQIVIYNENVEEIHPANSGKTLQQQKPVFGRVTDSSGSPLPGVSVVIKGTTTGTITDVNGNYSLPNVPENATLQFSFVGMKGLEVVVAGKSTVNVKMEEDAIGIEEVVAVGYGTMKKSDLTGSVVRVNQATIKDRPNVSIVQSIQGSVPGLNIGQVNTSGGEPSISIRGRTSLSGLSAPLIVLDNVIFRGNLIDINPKDIESIDILKDASSAAIYGSQATNGVIIITTSKGKGPVDKPEINYTSSYSIEEPTKHLGVEGPDEFIKRMTNADLLFSRTKESGYLEPNPNYDVTGRFRTNQQINAYGNGRATDWYSLLTNKNMHNQNHNLSFSNRTKNSDYYVSVGYTDQVGYMVNEEYSRWNARININNSITDWLEIGVQSFMTISDYSGESVEPEEVYKNHPYAPAYNEDGSLVQNPDGLTINPLYVFEADDYDKRLTLFGNISGKIDIPFVRGLSFKTNYSNNYRIISKYYFRPYEASFLGVGSKRETLSENWSNDNILSYKRTFKEHHNIDFTFVYGIEKNGSSFTSASASSFINDQLGYNRLQAGSSELQGAASGAWEEVSLYNMGRLFYGFKQKYLFTGTVRRDGFSGFSKNNKFGIFPSASAAWVISQENFVIDNFDWMDYLKLRLSFGSNGNRTIGRYETLAKLTGGYNYIDGSNSSVYTQFITDLASPNLKWETTTGINVGLDFTVLNHRLNGNIEYYNNNTRDLLYNVDIPGISRFEKFPDNLGKIHNHGIEFSVNSVNVKKKSFEWNSSFVFSRNRNEIRELLGFDLDEDGIEDDLVSEKLFIGKPLNTIYDYQITGELWQLGETIPSTADLGSYKIMDLNNDGIIDPENDRKIIGYGEPSYRFSIDNNFRFRNWTLGFFLNSVQGSEKYYLGQDNMTSFNTISGDIIWTQSFPPGLDYWLPENPNARYQKLSISIPSNSRGSSYIPRSFIRLQNVSLSYNFPRKLLDKVKITDLRLYINGRNLYTWTKWPGWDPETGQSITINGRPVLRSYSFGIDVKL
jgi:TonB-linked SusC/RagA family outer membrane protein